MGVHGPDRMARRVPTPLGCVLGLAAAVVSFVLMAIVLLQLAAAWARFNHSHDPRAADVAGWGVLFLSPVLLPVSLIASLLIGAWVFARLTRRR